MPGRGELTAHDLVSVAPGRYYANWMAECTATVKLLCDNFDMKNPGFQARGNELIDR